MRLTNVVIAAQEFEPMVDFYKILTDWPVFFENDKCCFLGRGKPHVVIHRIGKDTEVVPPQGTMCLDFSVQDLDEEVERLRKAGLQVEIRTDMAILRDPADNLVELIPAD